jgi:hypothetical protein
MTESDHHPATHYHSESKGLIRIDSMHSAHAWNTADKLEAADPDLHAPTIKAMRDHAQSQYDIWAKENPEDAAKANAKRVEKGLEPRKVTGE